MGAPRKTLRLLLFDDDGPDRLALERRLRHHEVFAAGSYDQAGDVLRRKTLDVVISDIRMPGSSGLDVLRLAARLQPDSQRIMFTAAPPEDLRRLLERETIHHFFDRGGVEPLIDLIETLSGGAQGDAEIRLRGSTRVATDGPVEIRCESWGQFIRTYAKDINHGGLFIQTGTPPPVDTELEVGILLPDDRALRLDARVVHLITPERAAAEGLEPGVGVQFLDLDEACRRRIQALVELARERLGQGDAAPGRSPEQEETLGRLRSELSALGGKDELAILGLERPDASAARQAFHRLAKRYHPDRFGKYDDPEIARLATEIFVLMKRAFTRVCQTTARGRPAPPESQRTRTMTCPVSQPAKRARADSPLRIALQRIADKQYSEAEQQLERILEQDADNTEARTWLYLVQARQLRAAGREREALARYHAVLRLDERNLEAVREVRAICESRRRGTLPLGAPKGD